MSQRESHVYDALKGCPEREVRHGEKAVLAVAFDDCCNQLAHLHNICNNIMENNRYVDADYAGEVLGFFTSWGEESGASAPELDHRLRLSSDLRVKTYQILAELHQDIKGCESHFPPSYGFSTG